MQGHPFDDMGILDKDMSEDCLFLNVWTPAKSPKDRFPVMVRIYGGGFFAGSTSEPRQNGANLAKKGVVVVSFNYRLGVFGFLSHPDLTRESDRNASGNYGLLDAVAGLQWVQKNIGAFGGDPHKVTIFGESAGSFAVSALMASPLAQGLFQRAIGESGAFFSSDTLPDKPRAESEEAGRKFAESLRASSIDALRAKPAAEVLAAYLKLDPFTFEPNIDGYFLPQSVPAIYAQGKQSHVPILAGWNADEASFEIASAKENPTVASFTEDAHKRFGEKADELLRLYPAANDAEARRSAQDLAGDQVDRLQHVEMDRDAPGNRKIADFPLPVRPGAARARRRPSRQPTHATRRLPLRRNRIRLPGARFEKARGAPKIARFPN